MYIKDSFNADKYFVSHLVYVHMYVMAIWYMYICYGNLVYVHMLWPFGICYGHLVNVHMLWQFGICYDLLAYIPAYNGVIWYIFPFLECCMYLEESGRRLHQQQVFKGRRKIFLSKFSTVLRSGPILFLCISKNGFFHSVPKRKAIRFGADFINHFSQ
jgi:hypothetical protein